MEGQVEVGRHLGDGVAAFRKLADVVGEVDLQALEEFVDLFLFMPMMRISMMISRSFSPKVFLRSAMVL
jgi:hypothetical protein